MSKNKGRGPAGHRFDAACGRLADLMPSGHLHAGTDPAGFINAVAGRMEDLYEALQEVDEAIEKYCKAHDIYGDGSPEAGRAWVLLRRAQSKVHARKEAR